jgi:predicted  nucleic acid-binding Zn-ribbon protein
MHATEQPFVSLIRLVELDQEIRVLHQKTQVVAEQIATIDDQDQAVDNQLEQLKRRMIDSQKAVDEFELLMRELDEDEKRKKRALDATNSPKEYQLLNREIEAIAQKRHGHEEELLTAWNALEAAQREYHAYQKTAQEKKAELAGHRQEQENQKASLEHACAQKEAERPQKELLVPHEWLEKYQHMRLSIADPVVAVVGDACSACSYQVTVQEMVRLKRSAILQCKSCYRLLYLPEAVESGTSAS